MSLPPDEIDAADEPVHLEQRHGRRRCREHHDRTAVVAASGRLLHRRQLHADEARGGVADQHIVAVAAQQRVVTAFDAQAAQQTVGLDAAIAEHAAGRDDQAGQRDIAVADQVIVAGPAFEPIVRGPRP